MKKICNGNALNINGKMVDRKAWRTYTMQISEGIMNYRFNEKINTMVITAKCILKKHFVYIAR